MNNGRGRQVTERIMIGGEHDLRISDMEPG